MSLLNKYLIHENGTCIELSKNIDIRTLPKGDYYISDMRSLKDGMKSRDTVPGLFGKKLLKWLDKNGYKYMTIEVRILYELAI